MYEKAVRQLDHAIALLRQEFKNAEQQIHQLQRSRDGIESSLRSLARVEKKSARLSRATAGHKALKARSSAPSRKPGRPVQVQGVPRSQSEKMVSAWQAYRQRKQSAKPD